MDLPILTNPGPKPPIHIYVDDVTTRALEVSTFSVSDLEVKTLETTGNVKIGGFLNSSTFSPGMAFFSANSTTVATPAGTAPGMMVYNPTLKKVTASSASTAATYMDTTNGTTWNALTLPVANLNINYSPTLNLYSATLVGGNAIYTSTTGATGAWNIQTPASFNFLGNAQFYSTRLNRFFADCTDAANTISYSNDGINYNKVAATRQTVFGFADSPELGIIVAVGDHGPMWSPDGITWTNSVQTFSMSAVVWSAFWGTFVATPRVSNLTSVYYSTDGKVWTQNAAAFPVGFSQNLRCITRPSNWGIFVAAGDNDTVMVSQDAISWRQVQLTAGPLANYAILYVDQWGELIMCGNTNKVRVSPKLFV